jgi:hypothetical protein
MSYPTVSACVLALLEQGAEDYKSIANRVREYFPSAQTTHKSVASLARDFRKAGKLAPSSRRVHEVQLSMIPLFEREVQLSMAFEPNF